MTGLGLNVAKYKAKVKNTDGDQYKTGYTEYPITEQEYAKLKIAIANKEPFTWIHDLDGNRLREINAKRDIKEFSPIVRSKNSYGVARSFCSFGNTHTYDTKCECDKIFGCNGIVFRNKLKEVLNLDIFYDSDITEEIRNQYLLTIKSGKS